MQPRSASPVARTATAAPTSTRPMPIAVNHAKQVLANHANKKQAASSAELAKQIDVLYRDQQNERSTVKKDDLVKFICKLDANTKRGVLAQLPDSSKQDLTDLVKKKTGKLYNMKRKRNLNDFMKDSSLAPKDPEPDKGGPGVR